MISKKTKGRKLSEKEVFSQVVKDEQPITAPSTKKLRGKEVFRASIDADEDELTPTEPFIEILSDSEQSDVDDEDDSSSLEGGDVGTEPSHVQETNVHNKDDVEVNESPYIQPNKHSQAAEIEEINVVRDQVRSTRVPQVISVDSPEIDELNEDSEDEDSLNETSRVQDTEVVQSAADEARDVVVYDSQNNEINEDMDMGGSDDITYGEPNDEEYTDSPYIPEYEESNTNSDEVHEDPRVQAIVEADPTETDGLGPETSSYHPQPTLQPIRKRRKIRKTTEVWTEEEVKALEEGLLKLRRPYWADIIRLAGPKLHRRTGPSLKDKARTMIRQLKRAGITRIEDMGPYRYVLSPDYDHRYDRVTIDNRPIRQL